MARQQSKSKQSVYYRQFQGGYAKVPEAQLRAVLEGYKQKVFSRNEVRVFAARWEAAALHKESSVSLYRIVNCESKRKGNRRLSHAKIEAASKLLDEHLPMLAEKVADSKDKQKPVARRALRHIARGGSTTVEALFLLAYFMRRISQSKPMQRLQKDEHYARFRYADFEAWTGVRRATQSRLLPRLMQRGYLNTVRVHQQNLNAYGQLFVDGAVLSVVRIRQAPRRTTKQRQPTRRAAEKKSTPATRMVNAGVQKTSTLTKHHPRRDIQNQEGLMERIQAGSLASHRNAEMRRIALRAVQGLQQEHSQAA